MDAHLVTRLLVAAAYLFAAKCVWSIRNDAPSVRKPARLFLASALLAWAIFYLFLAFTPLGDSPLAGPLSRGLHLPTAAAVSVLVWSRKMTGI